MNDSIPSTAKIDIRVPVKLEKAKIVEPISNERNPDIHIKALSFIILSIAIAVLLLLKIIARPKIRNVMPKICPIIKGVIIFLYF
jgi:hypothetical protein